MGKVNLISTVYMKLKKSSTVPQKSNYLKRYRSQIIVRDIVTV